MSKSLRPLLPIALLLAPVLAVPAMAATGDVTRKQLLAEVNQVFDLADANKDGFMSLAEFRVRMGKVLNRTPPGTTGAPTKAQAQRLLNAATTAFRRVDTNGDGKLSRVEANRRPIAAFDMMDSDHDGILTVAEKLAARTRTTGGTVPAAGKAAPAGR